MKRLLVRGHHRSGTTLLSEILRHEPDIYISYELGTYDFPFMPGSNEDRLQKILNTVYTHFSNMTDLRTDGINIRHEIEEKINTFTSPPEFIQAMEEVLFGDRFGIIGDKFPTVINEQQISSMLEAKMKLNIIWIYRDGRDVVSSCYRHGGQGKPPKVGDTRPLWSCVTPQEGSLRWAKTLDYWRYIKNKFQNVVPIMEIKFEDLIRFPHMVAEDIGNFLDISPELVYNSISQKASDRRSNIGNYKKIIPDWQNEFVPEATAMLKYLKYI